MGKHIMNTKPVSPPDPMSEACHKYFNEHWEMATFHLFILLLCADKDQLNRSVAKEVLKQENPNDRAKTFAQETLAGRTSVWGALMTRQQMLLQIVLCRAVDNYMTYISDLLAIVYSSKPEMMKTDDKLDYKEILQFESMKDLIGAMAERKVNALAYKSMKDLVNYLAKNTGFQLCEDTEWLNRITLIIDVRNLIVHNRATVNRIFLDRQKDYAGKIGEVIQLGTMQTLGDVDLLAASVVDIEHRASVKWGFPRPHPLKLHEERMAGVEKALSMTEVALENIKKEMEAEKSNSNHPA